VDGTGRRLNRDQQLPNSRQRPVPLTHGCATSDLEPGIRRNDHLANPNAQGSPPLDHQQKHHSFHAIRHS